MLIFTVKHFLQHLNLPFTIQKNEINQYTGTLVHRDSLVQEPEHPLALPKKSPTTTIPFGSKRPSDLTSIHKRAVTPEIWNDYACRGSKLIRLMSTSTNKATTTLGFPSESSFQNYDDLEENGWRAYDKSTQYDFENLGIGDVLKDLGFDQSSGGPMKEGVKNKVIGWMQDQRYEVEGKAYPASDAQYINTYNPTQGLLTAWSNYGPAYQLRNEENPVLPNLRQWSDTTFLEWQNQVSQLKPPPSSIQPPKFILRISIQNTDTLNLIDQVMRNLPDTDKPPGPSIWGVPVPAWPGKTFEMNTEAGQVLLGSPNGRGVAWFLLQHKKVFGVKSVQKIVIFRQGGGTHMGYWIGDVMAGDD